MNCENCDGTGVHSPMPDVLGMPDGWVQRCDECGIYEDDLVAMNAHRAQHGLPPMRGYPFSLVDRDDASVESPLSQRFFVRGVVGGLTVEASITLRNEGNSLFSQDELEDAIVANFVDWLRAAECLKGGPGDPTLWRSNVVVYDCDPVDEP